MYSSKDLFILSSSEVAERNHLLLNLQSEFSSLWAEKLGILSFLDEVWYFYWDFSDVEIKRWMDKK